MTNCRLFQTQRVCRQQFQIQWKWHKVLQAGRKHCGKRRNCLIQAISPFPTVFSKDLYCSHIKTRSCLGKGKKYHNFWLAESFGLADQKFSVFQIQPHLICCLQIKIFNLIMPKFLLSSWELTMVFFFSILLQKFFRRGLVENQSYVCKGEKDCGINPRNRNNCRYCRYQKCLFVGMSREGNESLFIYYIPMKKQFLCSRIKRSEAYYFLSFSICPSLLLFICLHKRNVKT